MPPALIEKIRYQELKRVVDLLTASSLDSLLTKIRSLASRPSRRLELSGVIEKKEYLNQLPSLHWVMTVTQVGSSLGLPFFFLSFRVYPRLILS